MAEELVRYELREGVAWIRLDDGKANALSPTALSALDEAFDRAEGEADAAVLGGRPGRFSAGFDLAVMGAGLDPMRALVLQGAELCARLLEFPRPVVAACTGHALAAGALTLLSTDYRVGARGAFKIGLNETAIGMTLPHFAIDLARGRLSKRHFARATAQAEIYTPDTAVDAGFLDDVADPEDLEEVAHDAALRLMAVDRQAFAATKGRGDGDLAKAVRSSGQAEFG